LLDGVKGITLPPKPSNGEVVTYYLYWIQLEKRDELARYLLDNNIYTTFRYWPLHKVSMFHHDPHTKLSNSELVTNITLNLPCHHSLSDNDVEYIVSKIKDFVKNN